MVRGRVQIVPNLSKNWDGRHFLTIVGAGAFSRYTKLRSTARYKNSFFPDATSSWNNMISNFQNIPTFTSLKSHLLSLIRPKIKSTFGTHDALGLLYLFQLRVNLSPLRSQKRRHNFSDTPIETCESWY